jgi:hypothetical protein
MKFPYLNKPITYILVAIIFGPYIALQMFHPEWLVRFVSIIFWWFLATCMFISIGISKKFALSGRVQLPSNFGKPTNRGLLISRIFAIFLGIIGLFFLIPLLKDVVLLLEQKENGLVIVQESVAYDSSIYIEWVRLVQYPSDGRNEFYAPFFSPRHIMQGKTYEFVYLPNSHLILEAHPVNASGTRE